jgi:flagellar biosynthesis chaperone FliJ
MEASMSENEMITYQAWLNELQITVDSLREQRDEDRKRIAELEKQVAMYRSMVERLKVLMSRGDDYR